jgi:DNA-binding SARP family transcriptional activator
MTALPITVAPDYALGAPSVRLFGTMEFTFGKTPTATKQRQLLALLASRAGQQVTMRTLIEELWPGLEIRKPRASVETYVRWLRKSFGHETIPRRPMGYTFAVDPMMVDAHRFGAYVDQAERESHGDVLAAQDTLRAAMSLWRGPVLEDVERGPVLYRWAAGVEDKYRTAQALGWGIALRQGRHRDILDELRAALREDWTAEHVAQLLMTALYRSGRQVEALAVFRTVRRALIEEQGLRPCRELQRLEQQILAGDSALELAAK